MNGDVISIGNMQLTVNLDGNDGVLIYEDYFTLNCRGNELLFHHNGTVINISEKEKRLLVCLIANINKKQDLIHVIWHENYSCIMDNQYYQIIYKVRQLFVRQDLPWIIKTICRYGVRLNANTMHQQSVQVAHDAHLNLAK